MNIVGDLLSQGVIFFRSQYEFLANVPCKLYKINEKHGSIRNHIHDYLQIWYVSNGEFFHTINGKQYKMVKGNIFVIPPYAIHSVDFIPGKSMEVIGCEFLPHFINERFDEFPLSNDVFGMFDFSYLKHFLIDKEQVVSKLTLTGQVDLAVKQILEEMLKEYTIREPFFELSLKANLLKLLTILIREYSNNEETNERNKYDQYQQNMNAAIEYIYNHYHEELRLEQVCKISMLSKTYFCELFRLITGKTFNEYVNELRIQKATELLLQGQSVTDVCFDVGFNNLPYFCNMFKKYTGVTPSYYRRNAT